MGLDNNNKSNNKNNSKNNNNNKNSSSNNNSSSSNNNNKNSSSSSSSSSDATGSSTSARLPHAGGSVDESQSQQDGSTRSTEVRLALTLCSFCGEGKHPTQLKSCSVCKGAKYCSKQCQVADWKIHKKHCSPKDANRTGKQLKKLFDVLQNCVDLPIFMYDTETKGSSSSGRTCSASGTRQSTSLESIVKSMRANHGQGITAMVFNTAEEFEDTCVQVSLATRSTRFEDGNWIVPHGVPIAAVSRFIPWPPNSDQASFGDEERKIVAQLMHVAAPRSETHFVLGLRVIAKEGVPHSGVFQYCCMSFARPKDLGPILGKRLGNVDASDASRELACKIESHDSFSKCRELLLRVQKMISKKCVFWLRNIVDPAQNGYLVKDLKTVKPRALKAVLQKVIQTSVTPTRICIAELAPVFLFPVCSLEQCTHLQEMYPSQLEMLELKTRLLEDTGLQRCYVFFLTYMHDDSDLYILTPFEFDR
ncbi:unnamed protein product [Polarella glacialis]|uniref:MYND-type domain-containing protein n=1 Tax=Polarella glacialis TaxID=89957 RepID=A0A813FPM9_POLGL|nr:unnamed protein product [Polarella glacialis]